MRTQPVIASVTILGTALSIFLIMTMLMMQLVSTMPFAPETHRDRMLYGRYFHVVGIGNNTSNSGGLSYYRAKQLYDGLEGVELMSVTSESPERLDVKGSTGESFPAEIRESDEVFWRIYDFDLLDGRYYTPEEIDAGSRVAVVSEGTALRLFGTGNAIGQHFLLNHNDYEVIGVVGNVSKLATCASGDVFIPVDVHTEGWNNNNFNMLRAALLVKDGVDFESVRTQVRARYAIADTELASNGFKTVYHGAPFDQEVIASGQSSSNMTPDLTTERTIRGIIYAVLLLVPAINLSSMLHSRLRRRISDIGVRRAFGCTRRRIITDIINENLIVTIAGGLIGLLAGILFALFCDGVYPTAYGESIHPSLSVLLNWRILVSAFGACFCLNVLSAAIPAWQAAGVNPVEAINAK